MERKSHALYFWLAITTSAILGVVALLTPLYQAQAQGTSDTPVFSKTGMSTVELITLLNTIKAKIEEKSPVVPAYLTVKNGNSPITSVNICPYTWSRTLNMGSQGPDVKKLQQFLNSDLATRITSAFGAAGNETEFFGPATANAVVRFQEKYSASVLAPAGLLQGTGYFGELTRRQLNKLCSNNVVTPGPIGTSTIENFTATPSSGTAPLSVSFSARASSSVASTYTLDFGDGTEGKFTVSQGAAASANNLVATHTYTNSGTYTAKLMKYSCPASSAISCAQVMRNVAELSITVRENNIEVPIAQELLIDQRNVYSPDPVVVGSQTYLYYGGWTTNSQVNDNIYRSTCNSSGKECGSPRVVIDSAANGFEHLNDPSIVRMPGINGSRDYFIMYMTGVLDGEDGFVPTNNDIYYATSWADDGVTWSKPVKLVDNHWLPSATLNADGEVELFVNDNGIHGNVTRLNLSKSGIDLKSTTRVNYGSATGTDVLYANPYVKYQSGSNQYYILAERMNNPSGIDAFVSTNGVNWTLTSSRIISPASGQVRVGTPAFHPNDRNLIYFNSTGQNDAMGYKIRIVSPTTNPFSQ